MTTRIHALRKVSGDVAAGEEIVRTFIRCEGSREQTANDLGISRTALYRFIEELKLWPALDKATKAHGFTEKTGRSRGKVPRAQRKAIAAGRQKQLQG